MSKGNHSPKAQLALVAISGAVLTDKQRLAKLQHVVAEQIGKVMQVDHENIVRRLFVGLGLLLIKDSLKHGEWLPWLKKHAPGGARYRQCAYMMSATREWITTQSLNNKDLATLPVGEWSLDVRDDSFSKLAKSAEKFIGEMTWSELLDRHGIGDKKKLGGARTAATKDGGAPSNEELYQFARDEIGLVLNHAETLFLKENRLQHLADHPEEIRGVVASIRKLADQVEAAAKPILKK